MKPVFISYAHVDNKPLAEGKKGWVAQFHCHLETRLGELLGAETEVWFDPELRAVEDFAKVIGRALEEADALVSVVTPRYLKSEWCLREARTFCEVAERKGGLLVKNKYRLVKTVKTPLDQGTSVPPPLDKIFNDQLGIQFFRIDPQTKRPEPFSEEFGAEALQRYHTKVYDLAWELRELLQTLGGTGVGKGSGAPHEAGRVAGSGEPSSVSPAAGQSKTVFLAWSAWDCAEVRDRIRRELLERGHVVLPDALLPELTTDWEKVVEDGLKRADLAVHIIGRDYGAVPPGHNHSIVELQCRLAATRSANSSLPRILWMPTNTETGDERQKAFFRASREDADALRSAELVQGTVEKLKDLILLRLKLPTKEIAAARPVGTETPWLYLICDQRDEQATAPLANFFFDTNVEVKRPDFTLSDADFRALHRQNLVDCDGVMIYWGTGNQKWLATLQSELKQAPGFGRNKPFRAKLIGVGRPEAPFKQNFRTLEADVIHLPETFSPEPLQPFVRRLTDPAVVSA